MTYSLCDVVKQRPLLTDRGHWSRHTQYDLIICCIIRILKMKIYMKRTQRIIEN
jgi:hypothetical protein